MLRSTLGLNSLSMPLALEDCDLADPYALDAKRREVDQASSGSLVLVR